MGACVSGLPALSSNPACALAQPQLTSISFLLPPTPCCSLSDALVTHYPQLLVPTTGAPPSLELDVAEWSALLAHDVVCLTSQAPLQGSSQCRITNKCDIGSVLMVLTWNAG
jgi:hypothetical protein